MKRILIIGGAGSGKSTLANKMGDILGLPVVHIDPMYWNAGWRQKPSEETVALACAAADKREWIFEGNNSASLPYRLARADLLIFLDVGTFRRLWRIVKRTIVYYGRQRPDMADGCVERFDFGFLKFAASYRIDGRPRALKLLQTNHPIKTIQLSSQSDVESFLSSLAR